MNRSRSVWLLGTAVGLCLAVTSPAFAQQAPAKAEAKPEAKAPAKPRGRLPAYFAQVVTPQQREKIYALQKPVMEKIDALEAQIAELKAQMEKDSRALLTPDQIKKIDELAAATQEKLKAAREAGAAKKPEQAAASASATTAKPAAAATPAAKK